MMGANWQSDKVETVYYKFAWWPTKSSFSRRRIWLQKYVVVEIYQDNEMSHPIRSNTWHLTYTKKEYLLHLIRKR